MSITCAHHDLRFLRLSFLLWRQGITPKAKQSAGRNRRVALHLCKTWPCVERQARSWKWRTDSRRQTVSFRARPQHTRAGRVTEDANAPSNVGKIEPDFVHTCGSHQREDANCTSLGAELRGGQSAELRLVRFECDRSERPSSSPTGFNPGTPLPPPEFQFQCGGQTDAAVVERLLSHFSKTSHSSQIFPQDEDFNAAMTDSACLKPLHVRSDLCACGKPSEGGRPPKNESCQIWKILNNSVAFGIGPQYCHSYK